MKTPQEWLAEQIGDRPEDFTPEDIDAALFWIERVQRDALRRTFTDWTLLLVMFLLGLAIGLTEHLSR